MSTVIDDLAGRRDLAAALELCTPGRPVPIGRLQALVCGAASTPDVERHGEAWLRALISMLERGGVGRLERDRSGELVLVPAGELPTAEVAWERVVDSWGPPPSG